MAGMDDAAMLADASSRALPEDDSPAETPSKSLWPESAGPAGLPVSLERESANPPGISIELVKVLKQVEEMKIAMEKLQAENQKMKVSELKRQAVLRTLVLLAATTMRGLGLSTGLRSRSTQEAHRTIT